MLQRSKSTRAGMCTCTCSGIGTSIGSSIGTGICSGTSICTRVGVTRSGLLSCNR